MLLFEVNIIHKKSNILNTQFKNRVNEKNKKDE
ncbi:hypothetical protein MBBAR_1c02870 [Methanobrevibacter arboriphilus JCM 13429 = DSM 1125]|uniref:Uncharacterized protein n=1 Tax=Methanobrevibacter arboriphilus JCM 13429 = DSM 1125 TaxID=1300164 RepID=A0A1V6N5M2_METAZ|nr:hypothetical protein MBBAR_1c02870 [Methanobrevibacter arboriphilus JCM 13429 = DSM 1125]